MRMYLAMAALAAALGVATSVAANDVWDSPAPDCGDADVADVCTQLIHGRPQEHDVQAVSPARDTDIMIVETKARHSYEVRLYNGSTRLTSTAYDPASWGTRSNRINAVGTVLTTSTLPDGYSVYGDAGGWSVIRWMGGASDQRDFIRVEGARYDNPTSNSRYTIELLDTTYFIPRFNNSGTQVTVLLIQNTTPAAVSGSIYFHNAAGTLLHTAMLSVPVFGMQVLATSSIPDLAGQSGSVMIAHLGGYGALAAKAVALEPATGFSFDSPAVPVPR